MALLVCFLPPTGVASDPGAEGRHPPARLLLPRRAGRGRDHGERLVRARGHRLSSAPGPSAELPGSGEDNAVSVSASVAPLRRCLFFTEWDFPPYIHQVVGSKYIRLYSPEDTEKLYPHQSQLLHNTSQVGSTVRGDVELSKTHTHSITNVWLLPCRWRWRIQTWSASRSLQRLRIRSVCCNPETCCSSQSATGTTSDPWSSASPSASGGRDSRSVTMEKTFASRREEKKKCEFDWFCCLSRRESVCSL